MMRSFYKSRIFIFCIGALVLSVLWLIRFDTETPRIGFTFSPRAAREAGLDPHNAFATLIAETKPGVIRLPITWNELESQRGIYAFQDFDWYVNTARTNNIPVIVTLLHNDGGSLCHEPAWVQNHDDADHAISLRNSVLVSIAHFKTFENIVAWQLGGDTRYHTCFENTFIEEFGRLTHKLDTRPTLLVGRDTSDELSFVDEHADMGGIRLARSFMPPAFHVFRIGTYGFGLNRFFVSVIDTTDTPGDMIRQVAFMRSLGPRYIVLPDAHAWYTASQAGDSSWIRLSRSFMDP